MYDYQDINLSNWGSSPSSVHLSDNQTAGFFRKYLMLRAFYPLKITIPEYWDLTYFMYTLFCRGFLAVVNTDKFGIIPQECGLTGYGVMYQPTHAVISNPLLKGIREPKIGIQTELIKLNPTYSGIYDIISYYADMLALCSQGVGVNLINSKLAYVFLASNARQAASFKTMMDKIYSGEPAVAIDRNIFDRKTGEVSWQYFEQNLKNTFIANDILLVQRKLLNEFDTMIGIGNTNTDKRERLTDDEVNANNEETESILTIMIESLTISIEKVKKMFPELDISIERRGEHEQKKRVINNGNKAV